MQAGDIHLADLGREQRWPVLVVSNDRFHRLSNRALVAPRIAVAADEVIPPWVVPAEDDAFALHLLRSVPMSRLLDRIGRASSTELQRAQRALRHIT